MVNSYSVANLSCNLLIAGFDVISYGMIRKKSRVNVVAGNDKDKKAKVRVDGVASSGKDRKVKVRVDGVAGSGKDRKTKVRANVVAGSEVEKNMENVKRNRVGSFICYSNFDFIDTSWIVHIVLIDDCLILLFSN